MSDSITPSRSPAQRAAIQRLNAAKKKYHGDHALWSRLYRIWRCMFFRCYRPSHKAYPRYGGRGITICPEWLEDYAVFRDWAVLNGYAETLTIDRKDNALGYTPENCRWATMAEQQANRSNNIMVTAWGETKTVQQWSCDPRCKIGRIGLYHRIHAGMNPEEAITLPSRTKKPRSTGDDQGFSGVAVFAPPR